MSSVHDGSPAAGTPVEGAVRPGQRPLLGRLLRSPGAALAGIAAVLIAAGRGVPAATPRRELASPSVTASISAPSIAADLLTAAPGPRQDSGVDALFARYDALIRHVEARAAHAPSPALDSALLRLRVLRQETWAETRRALHPAPPAPRS